MNTVSIILLGAFVLLGCVDKEAIRRETAAKTVHSAASGGEKVIDPWADNINLPPVVAEGVIKTVGTNLLVSTAFYPKIEGAHYELRGLVDGVNVGWSHGPTLNDPDASGWIDLDSTLDSAKPGVYDILVVSVKVQKLQSGFFARDVVDVVPTYARDRGLLNPHSARALHCTGEGMGTICVIRIEIKPNRIIEPAGDKHSSVETAIILEAERLSAEIPSQELGDTTAEQVLAVLPVEPVQAEPVQQEVVETPLPVSEEVASTPVDEPVKVRARHRGKKRHSKRHHKH